jgi:hypothetical protein
MLPYAPLQLSVSPVQNIVCSDNHVITLTGSKCIVFINIHERGLEGNTTAGKKGEALNIAIPIIHGISFCGLTIVIFPNLLNSYFVLFCHKCDIVDI